MTFIIPVTIIFGKASYGWLAGSSFLIFLKWALSKNTRTTN